MKSVVLWRMRLAPPLLGLAALLAPAVARAEGPAPEPAPKERTLVDRVVVRYFAPETGGAGRPRFITERELAFESRLEALADQTGGDPGAYEERFVRSAIDRHVAEDMLSYLMIERGTEPTDLPALADYARAELTVRVGGKAALDAAMLAEGIDETELRGLLFRRMRAAAYVDRTLVPILSPSEEELREAFRATVHPFRAARYEDVKAELSRWLVLERMRVAETEFLQSARTRVKIVIVPR